MSLPVVQKYFLEGILKRDEQPILSAICSSRDLSEQESLAVYRGSIVGHLVKCLLAIYPVCEQLVGKNFFARMAEIYALDERYLVTDLNQYGAHFPAFIRGFQPVQSLPYLSDVAQLEWFREYAFFGKPSSALSLQEIEQAIQQDEKDIYFHLPENSALMTSDYPIHRIWEAHQNDDIPEIDLQEGPVKLLIWRHHFTTRIDALSHEEYFCLSLIQHKLPFSTVCDRLSEQNMNIVELLPRLVLNKWIAGIKMELPKGT